MHFSFTTLIFNYNILTNIFRYLGAYQLDTQFIYMRLSLSGFIFKGKVHMHAYFLKNWRNKKSVLCNRVLRCTKGNITVSTSNHVWHYRKSNLKQIALFIRLNNKLTTKWKCIFQNKISQHAASGIMIIDSDGKVQNSKKLKHCRNTKNGGEEVENYVKC